MKSLLDDLKIDKTCVIAGVDEVGRGPLAGPVVAAAVVLDKDNDIPNICDSKKLSSKNRTIISENIKLNSLDWSIGRAEVEEIDELNILQASLLAMERAVQNLKINFDIVLVDGQHVPKTDIKAIAVIKGDNFVPAISAASIIAKVERDNEMIELDKIYPNYGFSAHKGYPTKQHIESLEKLGITAIHRRTFSPVNKYINR
ncbi:MAG: ribonuclease HII [Gammaproteobacteria bacterium]